MNKAIKSINRKVWTCFAGCFLLAAQVVSEEVPAYVSCAIQSQLGNQLFEISAALVTAWEHDAIPVFPELKKTDFNIPINREKIFFRLETECPSDIPWSGHGMEGLLWGKVKPETIPYVPNIYICGWNFNTNLFEPYRERLIEIFSPSASEEAAIMENYGNLLENPNLVAVHVRAYKPKVFHFIGLDYFQQAMNEFPDDYTFVIFSCRIDWAKKHLEGMKKNMVFIEGNDHVRDFFLMNKCKHHIIANSTYSFWAAYLKNDPEQIVIAPDLYSPNIDYFSTANGAYPPEWRVLHVEPNLSHPQDMDEFESTSIDRG